MTKKNNNKRTPETSQRQESGPWDNALNQMQEWMLGMEAA